MFIVRRLSALILVSRGHEPQKVLKQRHLSRGDRTAGAAPITTGSPPPLHLRSPKRERRFQHRLSSGAERRTATDSPARGEFNKPERRCYWSYSPERASVCAPPFDLEQGDPGSERGRARRFESDSWTEKDGRCETCRCRSRTLRKGSRSACGASHRWRM